MTLYRLAILSMIGLPLSAPAAGADGNSPFGLGIPANQTCAILWDAEDGVFSRTEFSERNRVVLTVPQSEDMTVLLLDLAGKSITLDLPHLHALPENTPEDAIVHLGRFTAGGSAYGPYAIFAEVGGCLPCPSDPAV